MTATSAVVDPDISEKNMLKTTTTCDSPPLMCPTSDSDRFGDPHHHVRRTHEFAAKRKKGIASNASESTPSKTFWMIAASETSVSSAPTKNARQQRKRHGHTEIAEEQEAECHQSENDRRAHGRALIWTSASTDGISRSCSGGSG